MSSSKPLIGVILGASRQGRLSEVPAHWIHGLASQRHDLQVELVDVGHHPLPFFDAPPGLHAGGAPRSGISRSWGTALERLDGFVVVVPGDDPLRIGRQAASDCVRERTAFFHKPVGFVGYGKCAGMPNVHALRSLASALRMAPVSHEVHLNLREVMSVWQMERAFDEYPHLADAAHDMLDELSWWAHALRTARSPQGQRSPFTSLHRAWKRVHRWAQGLHTASPPSLAGRAVTGAVPWPR